VGEADDQFCWLFLEDVGGVRYSALVEEHRRLAARWLGILHTSTERPSVESRLPDRGPSYFLECLRSARVRILGALANPCLSTDDLGVLEAILSRCEGLESRWDRVEGLCAAMPRTIVHGDFKEKNARIRAGASGAVLMPFDWACSGVGAPAIDLAQPPRPSSGFSCHPDLEAYWVVVRERWPALDLESVRRWAILGTVLRSLAALSWAAPGLSHEWVDKPMIEIRFYLSSIGGALEGTDLV
jgi:Ser/Thr protein kinase RdoA (MazF antagonist)